MKVTPPAVKVAAQELGLPVLQPEKIRDPSVVERLRELAPDLVVVVAYGQIIPRDVLAIPARGVVNVHASLLPRHRGAAPIAHAILAGDRMTGVTIMRMDEQLDHGPVLATRATAIGSRDVAVNRRAYHDYFIDEKLEAGIMLTGTEVKSVRNGRTNLRDGFVRIDGSEAWLENVHISPYAQANLMNHEPLRPRKLLLHRKEISSLIGKVRQKGYTLIPLRVYFSRNHAKVEVGLARGKKQYDKREAIAERDAKREIARAMRRR